MQKSSHLWFFLSIILIMLFLFGCTGSQAYPAYSASFGAAASADAAGGSPLPMATPTGSPLIARATSSLLLLLTPSPPPTPTPAVQTSAAEEAPALAIENNDVTVYITKTGECYHRGSCRYLHSSKIPILKNKAIALGYRPCKVCKP